MNRVIDFLKLRFVFIAASVVLIGAGLAATITVGGLNLGVDFQAGLRQQVEIDSNEVTVSLDDVRNALEEFDGTQVQSVGSDSEQRYSIRVIADGGDDGEASDLAADILSVLRNEFGESAVSEESSDFVGAAFSENLARQTFVLISVALALILLYVWIRFRLAYAISSILPLIHDLAFMLVFIGAFQVEISTATVAALLTVIGYSLNDTIVIFDRVRENEALMRGASFYEVVNTSITQSMTRTIITSLTTLLAVIAIYIFARGTVQDFALNLIVGVIVGTYSSIGIASPALLALQRRIGHKRKQADGAKAAQVKSEAHRQQPAPANAGAAASAGGGKASAPQVDERKAADVKEEIRRQRAAAGKSASGRSKGSSKKKKK
ncbi:MAG: protein translocase subunit SecF [Spirochaetales bacterium]